MNKLSRKEFIVTRNVDLYPWRVTFGVVGKLLLFAALLWVFPIEEYGVARGNGKFYLLGMAACAFWIGWGLIRKRSPASFDRCPNCEKKIFIHLGPVSPAQKGAGILNISLLPQGTVAYQDGICPHCRQCVWSEEPEHDSAVPLFTARQLNDSVTASLRTIFLSVFLLLLFSAILSCLVWGSVKLFLLAGVSHGAGIVFVAALALLSIRCFWGVITPCFQLLSCPACGAKLFDTDMERRTGRCHCCGERIAETE